MIMRSSPEPEYRRHQQSRQTNMVLDRDAQTAKEIAESRNENYIPDKGRCGGASPRRDPGRRRRLTRRRSHDP